MDNSERYANEVVREQNYLSAGVRLEKHATDEMVRYTALDLLTRWAAAIADSKMVSKIEMEDHTLIGMELLVVTRDQFRDIVREAYLAGRNGG